MLSDINSINDIEKISGEILLNQTKINNYLKTKLAKINTISNIVKTKTKMDQLPKEILRLLDNLETEMPEVDTMNEKIQENVDKSKSLVSEIYKEIKGNIVYVERLKRNPKIQEIQNKIKDNQIPTLQELSRVEVNKQDWEHDFPSEKYQGVHDVMNENVGKGGRSFKRRKSLKRRKSKSRRTRRS